ncbi:MAG: chemotaxis protein CheA [Candidatus Hodarchaeales archaeon]|jgi:two-component system chemotaxis sensor kinase CheA
MSNPDAEEFKEVMLLELAERINELNSQLLILEKDPTEKTAYDDTLRTLHSLKGLFSLSGYPKISSVTHSMENLLTSSDSAGFEKVINLLFKYSDQLKKLEQSLKGGKTPELLQFDNLTQHVSSLDEFMINLGSRLRVRAQYSADCKVVGARSIVLINKLKEKATISNIIPAFEEIEAGISFRDLIIELATQEDEESISEIVHNSQDVVSVKISRILEAAPAVSAEDGEVDAESLTVRVKLEDLDDIIRLLGDLVVSGQFIREIRERKADTRTFKDNFANFERTIANIQDLVIKMRLVPLDTIFTRFPRMVRDLGRSEGKQIDFITTGRNIGVDRSVIEKLVNPITHLLRNAVSHGIELPEERVAKNKDRIGRVKLAVTHERSDIVIEIWDNGKGLDYDNLKQKAVDLGFIKSDKEILTQEEMQSILFTQTISTSEGATEISGRGVGLNVVKESMESLGGNIEVVSVKDEYSSFRLIIPISVAITKVLLLSVKKNCFALPMANIEQILSVPLEKILVDNNSNAKSIVIDNNPVPIIDLRERLQFNTGYEQNLDLEMSYTESQTDMQKEIVVLWRKGNRSLGFIVNELLGERDVVMKPIHNFLSQVGSFSGATVLEGGQVVLIIDPMNFLEVKIGA